MWINVVQILTRIMEAFSPARAGSTFSSSRTKARSVIGHCTLTNQNLKSSQSKYWRKFRSNTPNQVEWFGCTCICNDIRATRPLANPSARAFARPCARSSRRPCDTVRAFTPTSDRPPVPQSARAFTHSVRRLASTVIQLVLGSAARPVVPTIC